MDERIRADIVCNLCGGVEVSAVSSRSRSGKPLRTVACYACGLAWSDPRPYQPRQFYQEDYRLAYKRTFEPRRKHVLRAGHIALSRLEKIKPYLRSPMRVLDVGSGGGEFAFLMRRMGHQVDGIEPNRGYANYAVREYGLSISQGLVGDMALPDAAYDLITIWHVLEHTEDPGAVLRQLGRALRPGGTLIVEVPNIEATCQSPSNSFHEGHLYSFNRLTLAALAEKSDLRAIAQQLSHDGGNITMALQLLPATSDGQARSWVQPGNHARVTGIVREHTRFRHWCSAHPYRRFAWRLRRSWGEMREKHAALSARDALERLYEQSLNGATAPRTAAARSSRFWPLVLCVYAVALLLEWALLDRLLPAKGWSETRAVGLYLLIQCVVVFGVVKATRRPRTLRQFAALAGWATPLFVLPAYC